MLSRLILNPYTLGALALLIVGMAGTIFYYRGEAIAAGADAARLAVERDTVIAISAQKDQEIHRLTVQSAIDGSILADIRTDVAKLTEGQLASNQQLTDLGNANAPVKTLLDTPYPVELDRLLNGQ